MKEILDQLVRVAITIEEVSKLSGSPSELPGNLAKNFQSKQV
ncbi:hypothetical protein [Winogradskyella alexanderae]|nr:hypothetical protein [Winogradskyella alexanderae]